MELGEPSTFCTSSGLDEGGNKGNKHFAFMLICARRVIGTKMGVGGALRTFQPVRNVSMCASAPLSYMLLALNKFVLISLSRPSPREQYTTRQVLIWAASAYKYVPDVETILV